MRVLIAAAALIGVAAGGPAPVVGHWLTVDGKAMVEVGPCGQAICGRITKVLKPRPGGPAVDANNPDPAQRSRPIVGLVILSGFTAAGDRWKGRVYDPESGRTYRSELIRAGTTLKVKGCIGPFCRTQDWTQVR